MGVLNGYTGKVSLNGTSAAPSISAWSISETNAPARGVASDSDGMEFSTPGAYDFTGTMSGYNESPLGFLKPGTAYVGYFQTSSHEYTGGIIIDSITQNCLLSQGGAMLSWSANFSSIGSSTAVFSDNNNPLLRQAVTSVTNTGVPQAFTSINCKAEYNPIVSGAHTGLFELPGFQSWSLTVACRNAPFVHKSGVTKRTRGPFAGSSASVSLLEGAINFFDSTGTVCEPGTVGALRLYVNSTEYFDCRYMQVAGLETNTPIEEGGNINETIRFDYTGFAQLTASGYTKGAIVDPNTVTLWP